MRRVLVSEVNLGSIVGSAFGENPFLKDHCTLQFLGIIMVDNNFSREDPPCGGGFLRHTGTLLSSYSTNDEMITRRCSVSQESLLSPCNFPHATLVHVPSTVIKSERLGFEHVDHFRDTFGLG